MSTFLSRRKLDSLCVTKFFCLPTDNKAAPKKASTTSSASSSSSGSSSESSSEDENETPKSAPPVTKEDVKPEPEKKVEPVASDTSGGFTHIFDQY